jgi:formamidopyrimidine-DNA glycosylase
MSVEMPEAKILAKQINETLKGKKVKQYDLKDVEKIHSIGFLNKNLKDFDILVGRTILGTVSRGNTIRIYMDESVNLILTPEYGGVVLYTPSDTDKRLYHLQLIFTDGGVLTVRLSGMGVIYAARDDKLEFIYVFHRDFGITPTPGEENFTYEGFKSQLTARNTQLKPLLVGKDAAIAGFGNSSFQDILFRSKIHPRRKSGELTEKEANTIFNAINDLVSDRLKAGGKSEWFDLKGRRGEYTPKMGPNMKARSCLRCGSAINSMNLGGGVVFYCPGCQKNLDF